VIPLPSFWFSFSFVAPAAHKIVLFLVHRTRNVFPVFAARSHRADAIPVGAPKATIASQASV
jgi:hypothetical protein